MAGNKKYQIFTNVNFKLTGVDDVLSKAKTRIEEVKKEIKNLDDEIAVARKSAKDAGYPVKEDATYNRLKNRQKALKDEQKQLDEIMKDGVRQFNVLRNEIDNVENLTAKGASVLRAKVAKMIPNINSMSAGAQEKIRRLAEVLRITTAEVQKFMAGFSDMSKPYNKVTGETLGESRDFIRLFEEQGHTLARNSKEYQKMAEHAAYSRENIAKINGVLVAGVKSNDDYTSSLKALIKEQQKLQQTKGSGVDASNTRIEARMRERELQDELGQHYAERLRNPMRYSSKELQEAVAGAEQWHEYMTQYYQELEREYDKYQEYITKNGGLISDAQGKEAKKELQAYLNAEGEATEEEKKRIAELTQITERYKEQVNQGLDANYYEELARFHKEQVSTQKEREKEERRFQDDLVKTKSLIETNTQATEDQKRVLTESGSLNMIGARMTSRNGKGAYYSNIQNLDKSALQEVKAVWMNVYNSLKNVTDRTDEENAKLNQAKEILKAVNTQLDYRNKAEQHSIQQLKEQFSVEMQIQQTSNKTLTNKSQSRVNEIARETAGILQELDQHSIEEQKQALAFATQLVESGKLKVTEQERLNNAIAKGNEILRENAQKQTTAKGENVLNQSSEFLNGRSSSIRNVSDIQQAIRDLEDYRKIVDVTTEDGKRKYADIGNAITQLKGKVTELNSKIVENGTKVSDSSAVLQKYMSGMGDAFKKPAEELERDKAALEKWRKELAKAGADKEIIEQIDDALKGINHELSMTGESTSDWRKTLELARNGKLSYTELKDAISKMRTELENTKLEDGGFAEKSRILQDMDRQLKATNKQLGYHASTLEQAASRLKSYILVYIGFNEAVASSKRLIKSNIEYSDSLANVQKISGLARSEINRLSDAVNALDTRTSQTELMNLAFEGSKLGVAAKSGAAGLTEYVEAANQLNQTLGEGGSAEAITQLMKINDVMGNTKAMGIKNALLATGSAILDIGNKSTASYGNVQQFVASLGGLAATAYIPMADLVAIAGTVDTTGQGIDKSATAIGKLISQIASKPKVIAQAVGIDPEEMENLVKTHKMTEALVMVLEKLKGAELGDISLRLKELVAGKTNQQALQVISSVAKQTDELNRQLAISRNAFDEASSATKMYNLMNEDAAGMIARMGNRIKYWFTNSNITTWLEDVLRKIVDLPRKIEQFSNTIKVAAIAIVASIGTVRFSLTGLEWEVKRLLVHIRHLWAAMMANPAGAIMAAVGAVITLGVAISDAIKARDLEYQATKRVDKATDDLTKSLNSEKGMASLLFNELKSLEKGSEEYDKVKNKIIANYGQYLEGQTEEIKNLENLAAAQEVVTKAIEDTTRAKIRDAAISEAYNSYLGSTGDEYVKIRDAYKQAGHSNEEAELFIDRIRNYLDAGKALPKALQDEVDKLDKKLNSTDFAGIPGFGGGGIASMSAYTGVVQSTINNTTKKAIQRIREAKKALDTEINNIDTKIGKFEQATKTATGGNGAGSGSGNGGGLPDLPQKEPKGPTPAEIEKNGIGSAMAQLETYFNERRAMIDDAYLKDEITYDERERELDAIEQEHLQKRYELRKYILGEQEKFETEKYLKMGEGELTVIRRNLKNLGEAEIDGIRKNAEADKAEMNKRLSDIKHEVEKITEVNNPFDNLIQKFASSIFKLNMLIDQSETDILRSPERMRKETEKRTMFLVEQSRRAYELTAQSLRESMNNEGLESWAAMLSDEEMAAIIIELQQFYHDYEETFRKSTDHLNTLMGMYWKQADYGKDGKSLFQIYNEQVSAAEQTLATDQKIAGWGYAGKTLAGNTRVQDAGIELSRQKIEMGMAEIEMIRAKMDAEIAAAKTNEQKNLLIRQQEDMTAEKMKAVNELIREEANQQIDAYASVISQLQPYAQALENFGSQFGEAIYGSKEDRQKAGQELLKSVIKTTTQIITQWLIMEATRKIQIQQEIMMEQYKQAMITAEYLKGEAARIQTEQAVFLYMTAKDTAEGIGKEVAHLGLKGFVIGAAITAAMALLTSAITPKYQAAAEATKAGGSGKLVTGMLTYAEGRYPVYADGQYEVQGRNGRSYNARYEDRLATRVYGGGARFGIFSEEMPEAVIDGPTTRRLTMDYSGIWKDILSLSRTGSLAPGSPYAQRMNAYANGNLSMIPAGNAAGTVAADNAALAQMIAQNNAIMQQLQAQLSAGIRARMTMFGDDDSLDSSITKMNRMKKKYGLGK